ncbi:DJ-1/PfpI family protein [Gloeothece verrucosa]|uniref:ThiJ/PfpI domain protein n=1 Tax=Gloeothece verrucosa (strain PCC 7822) TaxID=497965 RepID=E0UKN2_GLOV7|nr:DJ-1/PfpI family protein [Gloeothece verrucosa]ADN17512.1 ThiJ/PfpI domain protein [Gloeothece verrucosa PCC 7822]
MSIKTVGILAYHRCSESDTIVAFEVLRGVPVLLELLGRKDEAPEVKLVALDDGPIELQMGSRVEPHAVLKDDDLFDVLYVPGGQGSGKAIADERVLNCIRRHKQQGKFIAANCVGVGIIHRAGVIGDAQVTCSPPVLRRLKEEGINVINPRTMWLGAPEHKLWTMAGGSSINAGTMALVNFLWGEEIGKELSMWFDSRCAVGYVLFTNEGPEYFLYPEAEKKIQDDTADNLLPPLKK